MNWKRLFVTFSKPKQSLSKCDVFTHMVILKFRILLFLSKVEALILFFCDCLMTVLHLVSWRRMGSSCPGLWRARGGRTTSTSRITLSLSRYHQIQLSICYKNHPTKSRKYHHHNHESVEGVRQNTTNLDRSSNIMHLKYNTSDELYVYSKFMLKYIVDKYRYRLKWEKKISTVTIHSRQS
jgi:hypothetical protein